MQVETGIANRLGNRANNQDRCAVLTRGDSSLLLLGDGMGGHARGELAAQCYIDTLAQAFDRAELPVRQPERFLRDNLLAAHRAILALGLQQQPPVYPRTTAVACLIQHAQAWWAHVGDSRLYVIRTGQLLARTRDHTYVEELFQHNAISEAEMQTHPMRNYVTYCLGGPNEAAPASVSESLGVQADDVIMLCSDGLWGALDEGEIVRALTDGAIEQAVDDLAARADQASYPNSDNISLVALRVLADLHVDTGETNTDQIADHGARNDPGARLNDAIDTIRSALRDYRDELGKD